MIRTKVFVFLKLIIKIFYKMLNKIKKSYKKVNY